MLLHRVELRTTRRVCGSAPRNDHHVSARKSAGSSLPIASPAPSAYVEIIEVQREKLHAFVLAPQHERHRKKESKALHNPFFLRPTLRGAVVFFVVRSTGTIAHVDPKAYAFSHAQLRFCRRERNHHEGMG